jgi:hypothetical protein
MTTHVRVRTIVALTTILLTLFSGLTLAAPSHAATSGTMLVIGDSMSSGASNHAPYNNTRGSKWRGWWSFLGEETGLRPVVKAEPGSGYSRPGKWMDGSHACQGSTFERRIKRDSVAALVRSAKIVVITGGINDYRKVKADGSCSSFAGLTSNELTQQLTPYVHAMMSRVAAARKDRRTVYITSPWGRNSKTYRETITRVVQSEAKNFGFRYIDTAHGPLQAKSRTYDGTHPSESGSRAIADALYRSYRSQLVSVAEATSPAPRTTAPPPPAR